jgi:predicted NAD/FAD-dependent oxidoreductase
LRIGLAAGVAVAGVALGLGRSAEAARRPAVVDTWRIGLAAFPDSVGVAGYSCSGCDRNYSGADGMAAAAQPLQPLHVIIHKLGDRSAVYWQGIVQRDTGGGQAATEQVFLTVPPPYQVSLLTTRPLGYTLCPNARADVIIRQEDIDADAHAEPGAGRSVNVGWYFWSCRAPGRD